MNRKIVHKNGTYLSRVVLAQVGSGDLVADEREQRFERVPPGPFWQLPAGTLAAKGDEDRQDQPGGHQLQQHVLGDLKAEDLRQVDLDRIAEQRMNNSKLGESSRT